MPRLTAPVVSTSPRYPIRVVAGRVGLTEMTVRAWERRHAAVAPARSKGGQRLFSDADVERLLLLRVLTAQGTSISALAPLSTPALRRMAPDMAAASSMSVSVADGACARELTSELAGCRRAVGALDADRLHHTLMRLALECGPLAFLEEVASPLCAWIGDEWSRNRLSEAQEHSASQVLRQVLGFMLQTLRRERREHHVVLSTLAGERHEFGAMMAGIIAAHDGWRFHYLGADLPGSVIGSMVKRVEARLVAVSIIAPSGAAQPARELLALRQAAGRRVEIVVGGASSAVVDRVLAEARATRLDTLRDWRELLAQRRAGSEAKR
jgi:MerR family transcriptional regulator, light-induced transcriptional regulator